MGFTVSSLVLAICIIVQCVNSEKIDIEIISGPPITVPKYGPVASGGYMVQQITPEIYHVGPLFNFRRKKELLFPDRKINGSVYAWLEKDGTTKQHYFEELRHETLAIVMPVKANANQFIVGSNRNLRLLTKNETDYSISEPLIHFDDPGYVIYSAHCDSNGIMFILLIGTTEENKHLGKFYKVQNKSAELLTSRIKNPRDFRFNKDHTSMYIVYDNGRRIADVKYDIQTGDMGDATDVFDLDEYPHFYKYFMTSVVVDKQGDLWVSLAGKQGYVLRINPAEKTLISATAVPTKDLTFVTFGNNDYRNLFVGSKRTCVKGPAQGSIYAISGMGVEGLTDKPINW